MGGCSGVRAGGAGHGPGNRTPAGRPGAAGWTAATEAFVAHRNLLFTVAYEMLGSAADAEDVLQETWLRWAGVDLGHGAGPARVPGPDHHPPGADPAAHAPPAQGVLRRPVAARAAAHRAGRGRGCRAGRQRLDGDAAGDGDPDADRAGGVRAARGVRAGLRRDRRSRRQEPGRGPPDRPPGPGARGRAPAARGRVRGRDPRRARRVPAGGRDGRPAEPARPARAGRGPGGRRRRHPADRDRAHRRGRPGGSHCWPTDCPGWPARRRPSRRRSTAARR